MSFSTDNITTLENCFSLFKVVATSNITNRDIRLCFITICHISCGVLMYSIQDVFSLKQFPNQTSQLLFKMRSRKNIFRIVTNDYMF